MNVIDLTLYRNRKIIEHLEKKIGELSLSSEVGGVRQIKFYFKEWLKVNYH
jgi:hypothetical protein